MRYDHKVIEQKWQKHWASRDAYRTPVKPQKKFYCLDMFPYPSGVGLHVGHPRGYVATDVVSRFKRAQGFDVLHPMGWDSFGLPAENYAIKTGIHPATTTEQSIRRFKWQLQSMGLSYDWEREITTSNPDYYRWTQWLFLKLYEHGLAYQKKAPVNWCPSCKTVLANEQVTQGKCERCGTMVIQRHLKQWFFKITEYAEELLASLDNLDWPEPIKVMQRNWIGKSVGATIQFAVKEHGFTVDVFTTRPETLYGVTYLVLAPEHSLVKNLITKNQRTLVECYQQEIKTHSERDRQMNAKTGVFTGAFALHPLTQVKLPIWIADYVLPHYGSGAVMAVPAHDKRDWEFAQKYRLPIKFVVETSNEREVYTEPGKLINSPLWKGLHSERDFKQIIQTLEEQKIGLSDTRFRLRDWLVSRQRYWGTPIPIIYCGACGVCPVPEADLVVGLPHDVDFKPTGESPLTRSKEFQSVRCPKCQGKARRETDTLDTFVDSSWYFLRFVNPRLAEAAFRKSEILSWLPADLYVGGAEHAVLHLLYARFITKALDDILNLNLREPFKKLKNVGLILAQDGQKMSKSRGNVVNPDDVILKFGADTLRCYEMFLGPFEESMPWSADSVIGLRRWLERIWKLQDKVVEVGGYSPLNVNEVVKKVSNDIEHFKFNTAISELMILTSDLKRQMEISRQAYKTLVILLSPFAPHLAEELWQSLGSKSLIVHATWPKISETARMRVITLPVVIDGKLRTTLTLNPNLAEEAVVDLALKDANAKKHLEGKKIVRKIYVPNKILNFLTGKQS
ncbi:leucine--tRNA ligase [Candidatus Berkelbacteria bacterium]|nr:leucine--tRNA ligase [Candidatus Berkelbacteria bacterium]